jgi:hypothetical protein
MANIGSILGSLFGLLPPEPPMSGNGPIPESEMIEYRHKRYRHYRNMTATVILLSLAVIFGSAWAAGLLYRGSGFAFADKVALEHNAIHDNLTVLEKNQNEMRRLLMADAINSLEARLLDVRRRQCDAQAKGDTSRVTAYFDLLLELKHRYDLIAPAPWSPQDCSQI